MSQGDPNTSTRSNGDTEFGRQRRGGTRLEQMRGDNTAATEPMSTRTAEIGANGFGAAHWQGAAGNFLDREIA